MIYVIKLKEEFAHDGPEFVGEEGKPREFDSKKEAITYFESEGMDYDQWEITNDWLPTGEEGVERGIPAWPDEI